MGRREIAWLHGELPKLIRNGLLSPDTAEALARHYGPPDTIGGGRAIWVQMLLASFGALLVGGGVILILAHNWDLLGRPARTAVALGVLVGAQTLTGFALWRRRESAGWVEASSGLLVASVGASMALVAQTYHVPGSLDSFHRSWLWLVAAIPYLTGSRLASAGFWALLFVRATTAPEWQPGSWDLWPLVLAGLPFVVLTARREPRGWSVLLLAYAAATASFAVGLSGAAGSAWNGWEGLWAVFAVGYLAAILGLSSWPPGSGRESPWRRGLAAPARLGLLILGIVLTFDQPWRGLDVSDSLADRPLVAVTALVALGCAAWAGVSATRLWRGGAVADAIWVGAGPLVVICHAVALAGQDVAPQVAFNVWLAAAGIASLSAGVRGLRIGTANQGLATLTLLVAVRFFDTDVSFLVRGIAFVALGLACLGLNVFLVRRARRSAP